MVGRTAAVGTSSEGNPLSVIRWELVLALGACRTCSTMSMYEDALKFRNHNSVSGNNNLAVVPTRLCSSAESEALIRSPRPNYIRVRRPNCLRLTSPTSEWPKVIAPIPNLEMK